MFEIGTVIRFIVPDTVPPKIKYCIVVGTTSQEVATIFINTEIRFKELPELQGLQFPLSTEVCPFLKYNSFADCSIIMERSKSELNNILQQNPGRKEKSIPAKQISEIMNILKRSKTISSSEKKKFGIVSNV